MANLPEANVTIDDEAGAQAAGLDLLVVLAPVATAADITPRLYSSTKALLTKHGYSQGADYSAMHFEETKKPVLFIGLPIVTAGALGQEDQSGITGKGQITAAAASGGILDELDIIVTMTAGGTAGTNALAFDLSVDGGQTTKSIKLGTATSYTIPYVGVVLTFSGALAVDNVYTAYTSAPRTDMTNVQSARTALAAQSKQALRWILVGDLQTAQEASDLVTQVNAYETSNDRFVTCRAQVRDWRYRGGKMSRKHVYMQGTPSLTFAEVGASGDTITRDTGSWIADGFAVGDVVTVTGTASNNVSGPIASLSATVLTFGTTDLAAEVTAAATIIGSKPLTFAEVGATGDTITRTAGSWLSDGFKVGDTVTIAGTASNNVSGAIAALSATVLTFNATDLTPEVIGMHSVTITSAAELETDWLASNDTTFTSIDDKPRVDFGEGMGVKLSPISGWHFRRPAAWAASLRELQHDVQIPTWRKADGPCPGWSLEDAEGNTVEHDERITAGALAGRFTCFRTYSNGPAGAYIALSLTRGLEGSLLSRTHNMCVANVAQQVCLASTENAIGMVLVLNADGTGSDASLGLLEQIVNTDLQIALLQDKGEGPRVSSAVWSASRSDVLNVPGAELTGSLDLLLNGTLEKITTRVRIQTAG